MSPIEGPSPDRRGYDVIDDDDDDLHFFELVKNKIASSIIVPENCVSVQVLFILFFKTGREVTKWVKRI